MECRVVVERVLEFFECGSLALFTGTFAEGVSQTGGDSVFASKS